MGNRITSKEWNILCGSEMQIRLSYNGPGHEEGVTFTNSTTPTRRFQQGTQPRKGMNPPEIHRTLRLALLCCTLGKGGGNKTSGSIADCKPLSLTDKLF